MLSERHVLVLVREALEMHQSDLLFACLLFVGCNTDEIPSPVAGEPGVVLPGVIVEATWLKAYQEDVLILDSRSLEQYQAGHIPGAVSLPVTEINGNGKDKNNLASIPDIEGTLGSRGVRMDQPVVVYDGALDHRPAARLFWALEVHGHPDAGVLSGGLPAWQEGSSQPLQTAATSLNPGKFIAVLQPSRTATELLVLQASSTGSALILDSRSRPEYLGEASGGLRMGHIQGAEHHDYSENLLFDVDSATCKLQSIEELQAQYGNLPKDKPIIAYCNTGTHASVSYLALRALGRDVSVYDGGWVEWSGNPNLPIRTGLNP
jgi:thiosulfate/3-mercaptopyruvate sulfurtransferase